MRDAPAILYVEDNRIAVRSIRRAVERIGAVLVHAENGAQARAHLTERFAVVLVDFQLPDMAGPAIVAMVRAAWPAVPIVVLSGSGMKGEEEACRVAGCTAFLIKPVEPPVLEALLRPYIG